MADLCFRVREGWEELADLEGLDLSGLWAALGQRDLVAVREALIEADVIDEDAALVDAAMIREPDDMWGEFTRVWVKLADPRRWRPGSPSMGARPRERTVIEGNRFVAHISANRRMADINDQKLKGVLPLMNVQDLAELRDLAQEMIDFMGDE